MINKWNDFGQTLGLCEIRDIEEGDLNSLSDIDNEDRPSRARRSSDTIPLPASPTQLRCPDAQCHKVFSGDRKIDFVRHYGTRMMFFRWIRHVLRHHLRIDIKFTDPCASCSKVFTKASLFIDHRCHQTVNTRRYRVQLHSLRKDLYLRLGINAHRRGKTRSVCDTNPARPPAPPNDSDGNPPLPKTIVGAPLDGDVNSNTFSMDLPTVQGFQDQAIEFNSFLNSSQPRDGDTLAAPLWCDAFVGPNSQISFAD